MNNKVSQRQIKKVVNKIALLVLHRKHVPKIHDLLGLETLLLSIEPDIKELQEDLIILNRYYITTRYPGDFLEISWNSLGKTQKKHTMLRSV